MPEVISKIERIQDPQKIITHVVTRQSTERMEPAAPDNPRSYRQEHFQGIFTLTEEYLDVSQQVWQGQVDGTVNSEPLETHVMFKNVPSDIKTNWLKWKTGQGTTPVDWDPNKTGNEIFSVFYEMYSSGFVVYNAPRIVLRATGVESGPPDQYGMGLINEDYINKIPDIQGRVPDNVSFLLTAARGVQEGEVWRNTYEWLGSAINGQGWDTDIYSQ